jgi:hypothetical protein
MVVFENEFACLEETSLGIIFFPTPALRMDGIQARQLHRIFFSRISHPTAAAPLVVSRFFYAEVGVAFP